MLLEEFCLTNISEFYDHQFQLEEHLSHNKVQVGHYRETDDADKPPTN